MLDNFKYRLGYLFIFFFRRFIETFVFIYEIIRYPVKNISIWLVVLLSFVIYDNVEVSFKGKNMFLMSGGLVSIVIFITNFLEKQTVDIDNKDNFYLGYNIKKLKFYDNFWLKRFNDLSIKLLFWIVAVLPVIVICSELTYKSSIIEMLRGNIKKNIEYIYSVWGAVFIVVSFYCAALLIESVALSSKTFSQSYLYKSTNNYENSRIKFEIGKIFEREFNNIFNFKYIIEQDYRNFDKIEQIINYIINRADEVSSSYSEKLEFYEIAFNREREKIQDIIDNILSYDSKNKRNFVKKFLYSKYIKSIELYYNVKWSTLKKLDLLPQELINLAKNDLWMLYNVEKQMCQDDEYKRIFFRNYNEMNSKLYYTKNDRKRHVCISRIVEIIECRINDIEFFNDIDNLEEVLGLFDVLNKIDSKIKDEQYFSMIYKVLFEHILIENHKDKEFFVNFFKRMNSKDLPDFLVNERNSVSKEILMSGKIITDSVLEYLLNFLKLEDISTVLIFKILYTDRSSRKLMDSDEFKIWDKAINKCKLEKSITELKKFKFINELISVLSKSAVSHFIYDEFIKWMWSSLFTTFNEKKYIEFVKFGEKGRRRNFELNSYILIRLLLCDHSYKKINISGFENKDRIKNELHDIRGILEIKGMLTSF